MASVTSAEKDSTLSRGTTPVSYSTSIDVATLLGSVGAFAIIGTAMVLGGSPKSFLDVPALLIVFGGTFLVTTISFSWDEVVRAQGVMLRAVFYQSESPADAAMRMLYVADRVRREGPQVMESAMKNAHAGRFLLQAMSLVEDGLPAEEIEQLLVRESLATRDRHVRSAGVLRRAGEVAPAMGLIGTLVGLVQMLGNLDDPSSIGPSMAVALLTTFYGAILANMFFNPLANKLERNSEIELMVNHVYAVGATSVSRQENPRRLEMMINTALAPVQRVNYFD
ncbi:MAG TPA: MotA/TolQ/ExbB proton channel family protein [Kiloniellales bacterium]|jgi:chemotaxis protein MotA